MTDYTKTTDFAAKDSLPSGNSGKIIRGAEFETEFDNIATAIATKIDETGGTFSGTVNFADISATDTTTATLSVTGTSTLGDAATDTVTFTADIASNFIPSVNNTYELGSSDDQWNKLYVNSISLNGADITATAAELNVLDGITATVDELNILDGVTATTAELNYVDGVTSDIQTQLAAKMPKAGGTFTGDIKLANNVNLNIGTNSEMQIVRTDTASIIQDVGNNDLFLLSNGPNGVVLGKDSPFERGLRVLTDAGVELYHDDNLKAETTSDGFEVAGVTDTDQLRVTTPTVPASASATGTAGDIAWDADYIYVCTSTDTWKRVAIATW